MVFDMGYVLNNTYLGYILLHTSVVDSDTFDLEGYHLHRGYFGFGKKVIEDILHIGEGVDNIHKAAADMGYNLHRAAEDKTDYKDYSFVSYLVAGILPT